MGRYDYAGREQNMVKARIHCENMEKQHSQEIARSTMKTVLFNYDFVPHKDRPKTEEMTVLVEDLDSVAAVHKYAGEGKIALLNFASYKAPGGKFLVGAMAQEEAICHESTLFNVLRRFGPTYYAWNQKNLNRGFYLNRALYSPDILFKDVFCDVITCAAPNWGPAS